MDDIPRFIEERFDAYHEPAVFAVEAAQTRYNFCRFYRREDLEQPLVHRPLLILGVDDDCPSPPVRLLWRKTGVFVPALVEIIDAAIRFASPRDGGYRIDDCFQLRFRLLNLVECIF